MITRTIQDLFSSFISDRKTEDNRDSHVLIIDGLNTFIRVFAVVPALNDDGQHVGGTVGFLRSIGANIRQFASTRCIVVFDGKGGSARRRKLYPDYKANRKVRKSLNRHDEFKNLEDERASMSRQIVRILEYINVLPVTFIALDNIEADDTIAYIARQYYEGVDNKITIVSSDRDFIQLANNQVRIWSPVKKKLYTPDRIVKEWGLHPKNYLLYRVIDGDSSDNIPGVKGVGLKTLQKRFPTINDKNIEITNLLEYAKKEIDNGSNIKVYKDMVAAEETLILNNKLMQLEDVDISADQKMQIINKLNGPIETLDIVAFKKMFMQDKLYTIIKDVDRWLFNTFTKLNSYVKKLR